MKKFIAAIAILAIVSQFANAQDKLTGEWPAGGGKITVTPTGDPVVTSGLEFVAAEGILTKGESPAPFQFFLNSATAPGNVTLAAVAPVTFDGPLTLDVSASAGASFADVTAEWVDGATPTSFPVTTIPEPATGLMAAFGLVGLLGLRRRR